MDYRMLCVVLLSFLAYTNAEQVKFVDCGKYFMKFIYLTIRIMSSFPVYVFLNPYFLCFSLQAQYKVKL